MTAKTKMPSLKARCLALESIIKDIHWMARRYADGRSTYATGMFNDATRLALRLGLDLRTARSADKTVFARDGMGRAYDGLTEEEAEEGKKP